MLVHKVHDNVYGLLNGNCFIHMLEEKITAKIFIYQTQLYQLICISKTARVSQGISSTNETAAHPA